MLQIKSKFFIPYNYSSLLKKKVAIVTGASRGIGKSICDAFAKEGAKVVAVARSFDENKKIEKLGLGEKYFLKADVSKYEDVKKVVDSTVNKYSKVDILVNNAAISGPVGLLHDASVEDLEKSF
jgi:NAD(P)-dependent dehydrogenase (short-subunit alcohol dehydrogenase family)